MKSVFVKLREYLNEATSTEQVIIEYLLDNPEEAVEMSISELSKCSYASMATISRLCHKTGFKNYKDFQKSLAQENVIRETEILDKNCNIAKGDSTKELIEKVIHKSISSLEDTKSLVDPKTLEKSVDLLMKSNRISLFGIGASLLVAKDAYLKFLRLNKTCIVNDDSHAQVVQAKNMTSQDVAIVLSYSGMTREIVKCAEILKNAKVPIIAITCFRESKLAKLADCNLYVSATEFEFRTGKLASTLSQLVIVDLLYASYVQRDYENSMDALKRTFISKTENEWRR